MAHSAHGKRGKRMWHTDLVRCRRAAAVHTRPICCREPHSATQPQAAACRHTHLPLVAVREPRTLRAALRVQKHMAGRHGAWVWQGQVGSRTGRVRPSGPRSARVRYV